MSDLDSLLSMMGDEEDLPERVEKKVGIGESSDVKAVSNWLLFNGFDHVQDMFRNKNGMHMLRYKESQLVAALGPLDGSDLYIALHPEALNKPRAVAPAPNIEVVKPPAQFTQSRSPNMRQPPQNFAMSTPASRSRLALAMAGKKAPPVQRKAKPVSKGAPKVQRTKGIVAGVTSSAPVATYRPTQDEFAEKISGIRVKNRRIGAVDLDNMVSGIKVIPLKSLPRYVNDNAIDIDYIVAGVVCSKQEPRQSKNGKAFQIIHLNDMRGTEISVFFFGEAFQANKRLEDGTLIFLQNASLVPRKTSDNNYRKDSGIALSIRDPAQLLNVGRSMDMGYCQAYRKNKRTHINTDIKCNQVIDLRQGDKCDYHLKAAYQTAFASRPDLNKTRIASDRLFGAKKVPQTHLSSGVKFNVGGKNIKAVTSIPGNDATPGVKASRKSLESFQSHRQTSRSQYRQQEYQKKLDREADLKRQQNMTVAERLRELEKGAKRSQLQQRDRSSGQAGRETASTISSHELARRTTAFQAGASSSLSYVRDAHRAAQPMLGRGMSTSGLVTLDAPTGQLSVAEHAKMAQKRAAEALKAKMKTSGKFKKPNPNVPQSRDIAYDGPQKPKKVAPKRKAPTFAAAALSSSSSSSSAPLPVSDGSFEVARPKKKMKHGEVDLNDPEVQRILNATSRNAAVAEREKEVELSNRWDALEQQERIEERLATQTSEIVTVFHCKVCNTTLQYISSLCKERKHKVDKLKTKKRAFECTECKWRTFTLAKKSPDITCKKCGNARFKPTSMVYLKSRRVNTNDADKKLKVNPYTERQSLRTT